MMIFETMISWRWRRLWATPSRSPAGRVQGRFIAFKVEQQKEADRPCCFSPWLNVHRKRPGDAVPPAKLFNSRRRASVPRGRAAIPRPLKRAFRKELNLIAAVAQPIKGERPAGDVELSSRLILPTWIKLAPIEANRPKDVQPDGEREQRIGQALTRFYASARSWGRCELVSIRLGTPRRLWTLSNGVQPYHPFPVPQMEEAMGIFRVSTSARAFRRRARQLTQVWRAALFIRITDLFGAGRDSLFGA
jgi:hypothetical protein